MVLGRQAFGIFGLAIGVALLSLVLLAVPAWAQSTTTLTVEKTGDPNTVEEGDTVTYEIVVTNTGSNVAENVELVDDLPNAVDLISADSDDFTCAEEPTDDSANEVTCTLESLGDTATATVTIVAEAAGNGTFTNRATANSADADPDSDTADTVVGDDDNGAGGDQYDDNGDNGDQNDADDDRDNIINVPDKDLPKTGGPPLLGILFAVVAGAGLLTAVVRRRY